MILNFEFFNFTFTRLRYLDAATANISNFKPDGHPAAYFAGLVTSARVGNGKRVGANSNERSR